jgi:formate dehydrogenase subunit gamma
MTTPRAHTRLGACAIMATILLLGMASIVAPSYAQQPPTRQVPLVNPDANAVKEQDLLRQFPRIQGRILIPDQRESVLEQPAGKSWRFFHEVLLHWLGAVVIVGAIALLTVAYLVIGRIRIAEGRSGWRVLRFNTFERFSHWLTAASFVILAVTGLNITFGKLLLLPLIGGDGFSRVAEAGKYVHNFVSFSFVAGLVLIVAMWLRDNVPRKVDVVWLKEGGGFVGSKHPPAGRFNAGEKMVFWFALGGGGAVAVSGYLLMFPFYGTNIAGMQLVQVVHSVIAIVFIAVILGHIYIGTLGMEGAFEAMRTGSVDLNWAKEHHELWLRDEIAKGRKPMPPPEASGSPAE